MSGAGHLPVVDLDQYNETCRKICLTCPFLAPCKGIQDTLGFWIPRRGFRIPFTGFQIFFSGTWIPDSNC